MEVQTAFILLFIFLANCCWAGEVTISVNDTTLVTVPPNIWDGSDSYYESPSCGAYRRLDVTGSSVSLTFEGTSVVVNFASNLSGRVAQLVLDGTNVSQFETFMGSGRPPSTCQLTWSSTLLTNQRHTVTVIALDRSQRAAAALSPENLGSIAVLGFAYVTPGGSTPASPPNTGASSRSSNAGIIVGAVAGGVIVLLLGFGTWLYRRKKARQARSQTSLPDFAGKAGVMPVIVSQTRSTEALPQYGSVEEKTVSSLAVPSVHGPDVPMHSRLSENELDVVQRLVERNVPGPAITALVDSMLNRDRDAAGATASTRPNPDMGEDPPPVYDPKEKVEVFRVNEEYTGRTEARS